MQIIKVMLNMELNGHTLSQTSYLGLSTKIFGKQYFKLASSVILNQSRILAIIFGNIFTDFHTRCWKTNDILEKGYKLLYMELTPVLH